MEILIGYLDGDGYIEIGPQKQNSKNPNYQPKSTIRSRIVLRLHKRDKELLELIVKHLESGVVNIHSENAFVLKITKLADLTKKIIPLFEQNPIQGVKQLDFLDFCMVAKIMSEGKHLTTEGLESIITIKNKMNTKRKID